MRRRGFQNKRRMRRVNERGTTGAGVAGRGDVRDDRGQGDDCCAGAAGRE